MSCPSCFQKMQQQRNEFKQVVSQAREESVKQQASIAIIYQNEQYILMKASEAVKSFVSILDIIPFS